MRADERFSEDLRQGVHIAMGGFALALPFLQWWQSLILASLAVVFNVFALQKLLGVRLFRPGERLRRLTSGIVLYPLSIVGLLLVFPARLDIVAAAWGILAAGDGMATIVGRRWPIAAVPWNPRKSVGGSLALTVFGGAAGAGLAWWCRETVVPPAFAWYALAPLAAAAVAAAVETIPISLDDNVSVSGSAAAVLWAISLVSTDLVVEAVLARVWILPAAVFANLVVASAGYRAGTVTVSGAVAGTALGAVILASTGLAGWTLLLASFACAVATSRIGLARKRVLGIAEERGGRRGAGNAIANTGVATVAAVMSVVTYAHDPARLAFVTALVAGASDTVASEVGKAWGSRTFLVTTARVVPPGTSGAMSLEGTLAGLASAALLTLGAAALGLIPLVLSFVVVAGATAGAIVESLLGATLEHRGIVNNDVLNFLNTSIAALVAVELARLV
jgi:uncharacterized protein (TIGR00297 family)